MKRAIAASLMLAFAGACAHEPPGNGAGPFRTETAADAETKFSSHFRFFEHVMALKPYVIFGDFKHSDPLFADMVSSDSFIAAMQAAGRSCLAMERPQKFQRFNEAAAAGELSPEEYAQAIDSDKSIRPMHMSVEENKRRFANIGRAIRLGKNAGVKIHFVDRMDGMEAFHRYKRTAARGTPEEREQARIRFMEARTEDSRLAQRIQAVSSERGCIVAYGALHGSNLYAEKDLDEHLGEEDTVRIGIVRNREALRPAILIMGEDVPEHIYIAEEKLMITPPERETAPATELKDWLPRFIPRDPG